ncbi:SWI/SNF complex 60 kDa subunit [Auriculariales sp. MPI-PUGE-AT-0066]|nr:SWI/SNF complex 60 kDa subunit [Auriculariales sp. MPI-PUGE-AT-0066]
MSNASHIEPPKNIKKRKITDKSLPASLANEFEESAMYQQLVDMERKLDWTMTRKQAEISDALSKTPSTTRTLRIFLSHSVSGQTWQEPPQTADSAGGIDLESEQNIPAWTFRVEGRLLETASKSQSKAPARKFSHFVRRIVIEFDQDPNLSSQPNIVEWARGPSVPEQDGFEVKRRGDQPVQARVLIHLQQTPDRFMLSPDLARVLDMTEDTRSNILTGLWSYIKLNGLQDKVDRKNIRKDDLLAPIFGPGVDSLPFHELPNVVNRHIRIPDPLELRYTVNVSAEAPAGSMTAFDVDIETEDIALREKQKAVVFNQSPESLKAIQEIDDEVAQVAQMVRNAKEKRDFLLQFAEDPVKFVDRWLASQSRDLEVVLGNEHGVKEEDMRRSDFFRLPWVEEAAAVQDGLRLANALNR